MKLLRVLPRPGILPIKRRIKLAYEILRGGCISDGEPWVIRALVCEACYAHLEILNFTDHTEALEKAEDTFGILASRLVGTPQQKKKGSVH